MEWQKWGLVEGFATILAPIFHTFTLTLLSLLFPLSFLLLARLSIAPHLLTYTLHPTPSSIILSLFINTNPPLIHTLVSLITVTSLSLALTGCVLRLHFSIAWVFLCVLQLCVGSGVEATVIAEIWSVHVSTGRVTWLVRALFFIGLYETMLVWSRAVVRPLVDDAIYRAMREEKSAERVAMGAAFGALWWWMLRDEIEMLGAIVDVKKEMLMGVTVYDFVCWIIYYMTVTTGGVRLAKGFAWFAKLLLCKETQKESDNYFEGNDLV